jgi:chemotaxis protein CheX
MSGEAAKVEYVNPFIESIHDLFGTMLGAKAKRCPAQLYEEGDGVTELTAFIGWSGPARGTIALAMPDETALVIAGRILSMEIAEVDETVMDAISEVVNIVAGGAKAKFSTANKLGTIDLSLPTVVYGPAYNVDHPSSALRIEVPFESDLGPFALRVTFEHVAKGK